MGWPRDEEIKKKIESCDLVVLHKLCLILSKFIKKYSILYIVYRREMGQSPQKVILQWDKVIRKLI